MEIGSSILGITAFAIFFIVYLNYVKIADLKEDVKMISRKYLLEMETVGLRAKPVKQRVHKRKKL